MASASLVGELEEALVAGFLGLKSGFNQIDQDAAGAGVAGFGKSHDALRDAGRERNALANRIVGDGHESIVHERKRVRLAA